MNPSGISAPPRPQRSPVISLLLLGGLVVYFFWFFVIRAREAQYVAIAQQGAAALANVCNHQQKAIYLRQ